MKSYKVQLVGQELIVKTDESEEHLFKTIDFINDKANEIMKNSRKLTRQNTALLAVLNIASELLKMKEENETYLETVREKVVEVSKMTSC